MNNNNNKKYYLKKRISNHKNIKLTHIYFPFNAKQIFPIGCSTSFSFVVFEHEIGNIFELAILKLQKKILETAHDCEIKNDKIFTSPWIINTSTFDSFKCACIFDNKIGIFMKDRLCKMNANGIREGLLFKEYHHIHSSCMNRDFIFISYNDVHDTHFVEIRKEDNLHLIYQNNWLTEIAYATFSNNNLFFFETKHDIAFKLWTICEAQNEKGFDFKPHEYVPHKITIDENDDQMNINSVISVSSDSELVMFGSKKDICVYHPQKGVGRYLLCDRVPIYNFFWKEWGLVLIHDSRNDIHFLDTENDDGWMDCEFVGMLFDMNLNATSYSLGFDSHPPRYAYTSIVSMNAHTIGLLQSNGTFTVIQIPSTEY